MDPVSQIYLQARGGTNDFTQPLQAFMQSRQLRQQREQFDEELSFKREQLEQQNAMDQLREASQRLLNQERGLDIQLKILAKERELQLQGARAEGMQLLLEAGHSGWSTAGLEDKLFNLLDRNPALNGDALVGQPLVKSFLLAREQRAAADRLRTGAAAAMTQAEKLGLEPSGLRVDERTGEALPVFARDQGQVTPLDQARFDIAKGNLQLREREIALREEALKQRNQGVNRAEFIDQQLRALSRSVLGATLTEQELKEAAERYGRIYDSTIGQSGPTPGPASNDPTDPLGIFQDEPQP